MAKRVLVAKVDGQEVGRRQTERPYKAAVVMLIKASGRIRLSWHTTVALAEKKVAADKTIDAEIEANPLHSEYKAGAHRLYRVTTEIEEVTR